VDREPIEPADTTVVRDAPPAPAPSSTVAPESTDPDDVSVDEAPSVDQVEVAPALAGQPIEIVAYGNGRQLQRLDLTSGSFVTQLVRRSPFGRPRLIVGDEWVMLPSADPDQPTIVVGDDGVIGEGAYGPTWQIAGTTDGMGLWVMSVDLADGGAGPIERVPISGGAVESFVLPGPPSRFDPSGGFVVDAPGGSYRVDGDDVDQITTGELIALGSDVALAEECDGTLTCSVVVIDRATGQRRALDVERPLNDFLLTSISIIGSASVAPDGALAMVLIVNPVDQSSAQPTLGVIDLTTGAVVEVGPAQDIDEAVWSPDARFLLYNRGGRIVAYEPVTGDSHVVAEELFAVDAFGVRVISS